MLIVDDSLCVHVGKLMIGTCEEGVNSVAWIAQILHIPKNGLALDHSWEITTKPLEYSA